MSKSNDSYIILQNLGFSFPDEWNTKQINDIAEFETGKRMKGGAQEIGDIFSIGGKHIDESGRIIFESPAYISEKFYDSLNTGKVFKNDILLVKDGATTGKVAFVRKTIFKKLAINEHVFLIRGKEHQKIINEFLYFIIFSQIGQKQIKQRFHGLIGGINRKHLGSIIIPLPPLSEQRNIAFILSTVQESIEKTEAVIQATQELKKSLMDHLFTYGPVPITEREQVQLKETEIGEIPKEWETVTIGDLLSIDLRNGLYKPRESYGKGNCNIIQINDLYVTSRVLKTNKLEQIDISSEELTKYKIQNNDLVINRVSKRREGVARTAVVRTTDEESRIVFESNMFRVRLNEELIDIDYFSYFSNDIKYFNQAMANSLKGNQTSINQDGLKSMLVPKPALIIQREIRDILLAIDDNIIINTQKRELLEILFKSLLKNLMTGEIRIKDLTLTKLNTAEVEL